ncbi:Hypothetical predicted protein [Cloeon dipterum]|uniref:Uncharacterized protein n=1 Tax=Cloeon dipterum TaxID=197152 RepID=A0A8S1C971_9INSE|nr:Hypothetical predicted protein [Cloeon dipterum]
MFVARALVIIFSALMASGPISPLGQSMSSEDTDKVMRKSYEFLERLDKQQFILIIGDLGGERSELSRFLRNDRTPILGENRFQFPRFDEDNKTGVMIIDWPVFNEPIIPPIQVDLMRAFVTKKIFDKASFLKILIVAPDDIKKNSNANILLSTFTKLAKVLYVNCDAFYYSIGIIGSVTSEQDETEYKAVLHAILNSLKHSEALLRDRSFSVFESGLEQQDEKTKLHSNSLYQRRSLLISHVRENYAFEVFMRPGSNENLWTQEKREKLRSFVFDKLSFSSPTKKELYQVVVTRATENYAYMNLDKFNNKSLATALRDRIVTTVLQTDFYKGNVGQINVFLSPDTKKPIDISTITKYYEDFISKIQDMNEEEFSAYLFELSPHAERRWTHQLVG